MSVTAAAGKASLALDLNHAFMPLLLDFAEGCTTAFGLTGADAARVRLACEEVFEYLCQTAKATPGVVIEATNNFYQAEIKFLFKARSFDPYAFNLTATVAPDEGETGNLGLLIASRSVDHFSIRHGGADGLALVLVKEKTYPPLSADELEQATPLTSFAVKKPEGEIAKRFSRSGARYYDDLCFPSAFRSPPRMVDMLAQGEYHLLVTTGKGTQGGAVGGGIVWHRLGRAMIEFYGPYVFDQPSGPDMSRDLVHGFLSAIAKTDAAGAVGRYTTPDLPEGYFELLGVIEYRLDSMNRESRHFYYRQLKEDTGSAVWADRQLEPFLREAYGRLVLPREILPAAFDGERLDAHSVFSVEFDRSQDSVTIRPVWDGEDRALNIAEHVRILRSEGLGNVFFELDLGISWQAKLVRPLFENGFTPVLLLPYAGQADIVVFQAAG